MILTPQNPYESFVVQASAGSGKTYQLSRRFLNLVAAWAAPETILTITFTVKAAQEMQSRIVAEASLLLEDPKRALEFEQELQDYYRSFRSSDYHPHAGSTPAPRSAKATAHAILSATQLLRISTIDSLFHEWVCKFPWEASLEKGKDQQPNFPFSIMDGASSQELNQLAWEKLFTLSTRSPELLAHCQTLMALNPEQGILGIEQKIFELYRYYTYLWQSEQRGSSVFWEHPISHLGDDQNVKALIATIATDLSLIARGCSKSEIFLYAIQQGDLALLQKEKLLTKDLSVSGILIRGKNREALGPSILRVEEVLRHFDNRQKLITLNETGKALYSLYQAWLEQRKLLKKKQGVIEFNDLSLQSYRLICDSMNSGIIWLIQKSLKHLLLDEFQDTSFLQWSIFQNLLTEMLAGQNYADGDKLHPSVFIVGDKKQSIYGFREAEPRVLDEATEVFASFNKPTVNLNANYRSSRLILDAVNKVFTTHFDPDFPLHVPACDSSEQDLIPNYGKIIVQPEFGAFDDSEEKTPALDAALGLTTLTPIQQEAEFVAQYLAQAFLDKDSHPVIVKGNQSLRPLTPKDCAILYRNSTHVEVFEKALRAKNIPYVKEEKKGFFLRPEIIDSLAFIKVCAKPYDIIAFLTVVMSPYIGIADHEVLSLLREQQKSQLRESRVLGLLQLIITHVSADPKAEIVHQRLLKWQDILSRSEFVLPHALFFQIMHEFDLNSAYAEAFPGSEGEIAQKNLVKFYELLIRCENEGSVNLLSCLTRLEELKKQNEIASASADQDAVKLMTIHKSKGLEFPFIALIEASDAWSKSDRYWTKTSSSPDSHHVTYVGVQKERPSAEQHFSQILSLQQQSLKEESARLLYVAMTRARQYLLITAHKSKQEKDSFFPILQDCLISYKY